MTARLRPRQPNPMPFAARLSATIAETCRATGLGKTKIYELINAGKIETFTVDARRLVRVWSVVQLLDPAYTPAYIDRAVSSGPARTTTEGEARWKTAPKPLSEAAPGQLRPRTNT